MDGSGFLKAESGSAIKTRIHPDPKHCSNYSPTIIFQSSQAAFNDHQEASANDDLGFGLDMADIDDMNPNGTDDGLGLGDLNDIFNDEPFTSGGANSPGDAREGDGCSNPNTPHSGQLPGQDPAFRSASKFDERACCRGCPFLYCTVPVPHPEFYLPKSQIGILAVNIQYGIFYCRYMFFAKNLLFDSFSNSTFT